MMNIRKHSVELAGRTLTLESGVMAKQSAGSVLVTYGDTVVLVAVNADPDPREGIDFLPLSVEYRERAYAGGKIPGGFFKREGRPSEKEILASRLTDRAIRPLFPKEFRCDTQVMINLLSTDQENPADVLGTIGASSALMQSNIPWSGPLASVRVGFANGKALLNPRYSELESSELDLVVTGNEESVVMLEGDARETPEDHLLTAIQVAHEAIKDLITLQKEFLSGREVVKREVQKQEANPDLLAEVNKRIDSVIDELISIPEKVRRSSAIRSFTQEVIADLEEPFPDSQGIVKSLIDARIEKRIREKILSDGTRVDGRSPTDIRPIVIRLGLLPRTHGSALFTRGETQSLTTVTLGSRSDEQFIDDINGEFKKKYMLHYNFPPFSVGEVRRYLGLSRREVGHGNLAERALKNAMPPFEDFPYTVRVVSDILESNGSSSMATVCAGSLALMDAGVPIRAAVAGVSIGLVKNDDKSVLLSDIMGLEDHYGDMDFKVAGTRKGITSVQLDLKIGGLSFDLIEKALQQAREDRLHILEIMDQHIEKPRESLSPLAPKILRLSIPADKIGDLIGPGGRTIRSVISECECEVDVDDDGIVIISSPSLENCEKARKMVEAITTEPEVGMVFEGTVMRITNFGAFVELVPGKEGLLHISEIAHERTERVEDAVSLGDVVKVKVIKVDEYGRFDLSVKALLERPKGMPASPDRGGARPDRRRHRPRHGPRRSSSGRTGQGNQSR
ncbi:MAG: polyribonucleotide nucleotidyltransferase [Fidelibacterota bacterium]